MKSFASVDVVNFYKRANLQVLYNDEYAIEYSDRTYYNLVHTQNNAVMTQNSDKVSQKQL